MRVAGLPPIDASSLISGVGAVGLHRSRGSNRGGHRGGQSCRLRGCRHRGPVLSIRSRAYRGHRGCRRLLISQSRSRGNRGGRSMDNSTHCHAPMQPRRRTWLDAQDFPGAWPFGPDPWALNNLQALSPRRWPCWQQAKQRLSLWSRRRSASPSSLPPFISSDRR